MDSRLYYSHHGKEWIPHGSIGYNVIEVLEFLKGKPCDEIALAYVEALRPSAVRITEGMMTCDCHLWRVTIVVNSENIIERIVQEVEVGLPEPFGCGYELEHFRKTGEYYKISDGLGIINTRGVRKLTEEKKF